MTPASHAGGPRFDPGLAYFVMNIRSGRIAQMVEHGSNKPRVGGSSPSVTTLLSAKRSYGVMVSTLDFESSDPGSNPGRTSLLVWRARGATTLVRRRRVASHAMASMAQLAERSAVNR